MVKVRWTDYALENLIAIGDYIERDSFFVHSNCLAIRPAVSLIYHTSNQNYISPH